MSAEGKAKIAVAQKKSWAAQRAATAATGAKKVMAVKKAVAKKGTVK